MSENPQAQIDKLGTDLDFAHTRIAALEAQVARIEKSNKSVNTKTLKQAQERAELLTELYHGTVATLSTVEMVLHSLWRVPPEQRPLALVDATTRMIRLMGHGPEYFIAREHLTIEQWLHVLAHITEEDMPAQCQGIMREDVGDGARHYMPPATH